MSFRICATWWRTLGNVRVSEKLCTSPVGSESIEKSLANGVKSGQRVEETSKLFFCLVFHFVVKDLCATSTGRSKSELKLATVATRSTERNSTYVTVITYILARTQPQQPFESKSVFIEEEQRSYSGYKQSARRISPGKAATLVCPVGDIRQTGSMPGEGDYQRQQAFSEFQENFCKDCQEQVASHETDWTSYVLNDNRLVCRSVCRVIKATLILNARELKKKQNKKKMSGLQCLGFAKQFCIEF